MMTGRFGRAAAAGALLMLAATAAPAQQTGGDTGVPTETQERVAEGQDNDSPWDLLGLLGLAGLLGLKRRDDDNRGSGR